MGVYEILKEWTAFRLNCIQRRTKYDLEKKKEKLHLLEGLQKILLDIDKAVKIVRQTEEESEVVPNLMIGFSIDEVQAENVAEIKLRNLNREYILKRTAEIEDLHKAISDLNEIMSSERKQKLIVIDELKNVINKYGQPRKTMFIYSDQIDETEINEEIPDYPVNLFISKSGYFKKITPQSLRMSAEQKLKDGDVMEAQLEASNRSELLFFTDKEQVYKSKASDFADSKASVLGDYVPAKLSFDEEENVRLMVVTTDYSGFMLFVFENGKVAKVPLNAYETKTNRKKLANAYSEKSKLVDIFYVSEHTDLMLRSSNGRMIIFNTAMLLPKSTRNTIGVQVMTLKAKSLLEKAFIVTPEQAADLEKYRVKTIPAAGAFAKDIEDPDQISLL